MGLQRQGSKSKLTQRAIHEEDSFCPLLFLNVKDFQKIQTIEAYLASSGLASEDHCRGIKSKVGEAYAYAFGVVGHTNATKDVQTLPDIRRRRRKSIRISVSLLLHSPE